MPGRLSPSPPISPPLPNSPEVMSLTETSRPIPEAHRLHQPESYITNASSPWSLHQASFGTSHMALPTPRQPNEPGYNAYRRDPNLVLHPVYHNEQRPATSLSRTPIHSHQSQSFSSTSSIPFDQYDGASREKRFEASPSPLGPMIKRDDSEEMPCLKELTALPSPSYKQARQTAPVHGEIEFTPQLILPDLLLRGASSRPMDLPSLNSSSDLSPNVQYDIIIRQQPVAARACGFGDRDRRVIDPPPILQLIIQDPGATPAELDSKTRYPLSVIHCELWNAEMDHDETSMPETGDRRQQRRLMGTLVASPFVGRDEFDVEGCYFPFPDLSCRTTGRYRLKFVLVVLDPARIKTGDKLPFRATVLSDVFEVYPAKTFPGMIKSTELTKRLKDQGCLISVKKGHQRTERATKASRSEEYEENDIEGDDANSPGREKRQRK